jgi:hypothetical protein
MTTVATRIRQIADLEDFDVQIIKDGTPLDPTTNGLPKFDFDRKMKGSATVSQWRAQRFYPGYAGYDCRVFYGNGQEANGNATLSTVRASYEEE